MKFNPFLLIIIAFLCVSCSTTDIEAGPQSISSVEESTLTPTAEFTPTYFPTLPPTLTPISITAQPEITPIALYTPIDLSDADNGVYQKALSDIPLYRQGDIQIKVQDEDGNPLPGYLVTYRQFSHDFLFGSVADPSQFDYLNKLGLNSLTVGMDWRWLQPERGLYTLEFANYWTGIDELKSGNMYVKTNNLFNVSESDMAPYFRGVPFDEFSRRLYEHVSTTVKRFAPSVDYWEAVLEPTIKNQNPLNLTEDEYYQAIATSIQAIRDNDPTAIIEISINYPCNTDWINYSLIVQKMLDRNIDFDVLGLQFYYNAYITWGNYQMPKKSFSEMSACYDKYETMITPYGKKISGSEISVPSEISAGQLGYWGIPWTEETQAQYLATLYTIFFSKPSNMDLIWFGLKEPSTFIDTGPLIREDGTPKKSFYTLQNLIEGWTTTGEGITNDSGFATFRGFAGDYELDIINPVNGESMVTQVHITEQDSINETINFIPNNILEEKKADLENLVAYWDSESDQIKVQKGNDYLALVNYHFQNYEWALAEQTLTAALEELVIITKVVVPNKELIPVGYLGGGYKMENGSYFILGSTTLHYPYTFPEGKVTVEITAHSQNEKGESPIMVSGIGNNYSPVWKVDSWPYEVFSFTVYTTGNEQDFTIRFPWDNQINDRITAKNGENWKLLLYIDQVKFIVETTEIP